MKRILLCLALLCGGTTLVITPSACTTSGKKIVYNSLYTVEVSTTTAHDVFLDQVVRGAVKTNGVPAVAGAYNKFQASMSAAIATARFDWQAPAPSDIIVLGNEVLEAIRKAKGSQ